MTSRNYEFFNNEDLSITIRWATTTGVPYDITEAYFTIKKRDTDTVPVVALKKSTGGIVYDAINKWCTAYVPEASMDDLAPGEYKYDFVLVRAADNKTDSLLSGRLMIKQGISIVG